MYKPFCTSRVLLPGRILRAFLGASWRTCGGSGVISFLKGQSEMGLCFSATRHCISGLGFGKGSYLPAPQEEDEDNLLSPETCYECKINGYPKRGRQRRSVNGTEKHQVRNPWLPGWAGARPELGHLESSAQSGSQCPLLGGCLCPDRASSSLWTCPCWLFVAAPEPRSPAGRESLSQEIRGGQDSLKRPTLVGFGHKCLDIYMEPRNKAGRAVPVGRRGLSPLSDSRLDLQVIPWREVLASAQGSPKKLTGLDRTD